MNLRLKLRKNQSTVEAEKITSDLHSMEILGEAIQKLPSLEHLKDCHYLYLQCPQLEELPTLPPALEILKIRSGQFKLKGNEFISLTKLKTFSFTQLRELKNNVELPGSIEVLDLGHNHLSELPPSVVTLKALSRLTLDSNHLIELPPELYLMKSLNHLSLDNNPLSEEAKNRLYKSFGVWF